MFDLSSIFQNGLEFQFKRSEVINAMKINNGNMTFPYVSILSEMINTHFAILTLISAIHIVLVIPSNLLAVFVIVKNKELWTTSNVVLSINGVIQAIGSAVALAPRSLWIHSFFLLPMNVRYKETLYLVVWWTYSVMMRTGNNR